MAVILNEKGSILDLFFIVPIIFMIVIVVLLASFILSEWDNQFTYERPEVFNQTIEDTHIALQIFDYMSVFIFVSLSMVVLVSALFVKTHPAFFGFTFILLAILVLASTLFSNIFGEFITDPNISTTASGFPIISVLMTNLPIFALVIAGLVSVVMYSNGGVRV